MARPITHARLVVDWRKTLDAFGDAIRGEDELRSFSSRELRQFEQHLAADRRWLQQFASIRSFP